MANPKPKSRKRLAQPIKLEQPEAPALWRGEEVDIKPTIHAVCAICWYSHASILLNDNVYHKPCLEAMKREYHPIPAGLFKESKA